MKTEKIIAIGRDHAGMTADELRAASDSNLAYYQNQLENFDPRFYKPLYSVSWGRDIKLRSGVVMSDEASSYIRSVFAGGGTQAAQGKPWIDPNTTTLPGVTIDGKKVVAPIRLLGREISYTSIELEKSRRAGTPIDVQKLEALNDLYQLNTDEMVYIGDTVVGETGLVNNADVPAADFDTGDWSNPATTVDQILADVNEALSQAYENTGNTLCPSDCLLPPLSFFALASRRIGESGERSVLKYIAENSAATAINGRPLNIRPLKWLTGRGAEGSGRAVFYTNEEALVRFVMVPMRREQAYYLGIKFNAPYVWAYGSVEFPKPETVLYRDGL